MTPVRQRFHYKWVIVIVCFTMVLITLGFCSSNSGIYNAAIADALGKPRSAVSIIKSFRFIATTIINLYFGLLIRRFGVRRLVAFGFLSLIGSTAAFAYATTLPVFYLGGLLLGIGIAFTSTTMASFIVRRWCTTNVGRYTGIVLASNGIGGAIAAQIMLPIVQAEPFGYRHAYKLIIIILIVTAVISVSLLREGPKVQSLTTEIPKKKNRGVFWQGIEYSTARRRAYFYIVAACVFITGLLLQGISDVKAVHMRDVQVPENIIVNLASISSLCLTFSKILVGIIYDRYGLRPIIFACHILTAVSFVLMCFISSAPFGITCATIAAIVMTFALPLETIMIPLLTNDLFGAASYDKLLGIFMAFNTAGFMLGAPLVNISYDLCGSYVPLFIVSAVVMLIVTIAFQVAAKSNEKDKNAVLSQNKT